LGIDTGIVLNFWGYIILRDHIDIDGIWEETIKIMKAGVLDTDLHILDIAIRYTNASPNLSQLLHKLEHCIGENAEVLNDHSKWSKLKVKRFRMDPNSREVITVMGSSSTEQLGN
jgi:hypothetical protein